jgi:flagellar biosynthesis chaperone FliJ
MVTRDLSNLQDWTNLPSGEANMLEQKLQELRYEYAKGQQQLAQLEQRRQELRDTMLRISGAIQVLEELQAAAVVEVEIRD